MGLCRTHGVRLRDLGCEGAERVVSPARANITTDNGDELLRSGCPHISQSSRFFGASSIPKFLRSVSAYTCMYHVFLGFQQ